MSIIISTEKSKDILRRLIRSDFDKIDFAMDYIYNKADDLIGVAYRYGLEDLAEEMKIDKIA
ncbi:hypothetical protein [Polaribacter sp. IC073]|uniref:hypothetical protein n=1 Tax=Polaribacter sp. IC073 TaxID=2508540 RepID=UPI0011BE5DC0|nr:hypothetical protein [Polaribacter sp. IC073]TXD45873.1 hypothetical protein ES045_15730 [Polaribacter sp. IC073]